MATGGLRAHEEPPPSNRIYTLTNTPASGLLAPWSNYFYVGAYKTGQPLTRNGIGKSPFL